MAHEAARVPEVAQRVQRRRLAAARLAAAATNGLLTARAAPLAEDGGVEPAQPLHLPQLVAIGAVRSCRQCRRWRCRRRRCGLGRGSFQARRPPRRSRGAGGRRGDEGRVSGPRAMVGGGMVIRTGPLPGMNRIGRLIENGALNF